MIHAMNCILQCIIYIDFRSVFECIRPGIQSYHIVYRVITLDLAYL